MNCGVVNSVLKCWSSRRLKTVNIAVRFVSSSKDNTINLIPKSSNVSYKQLRVETLKNVEKYPHKFSPTIGVNNFVTKYRNISHNDNLSDERVSLCGMVTNIREATNKLTFIDLEAQDNKVQLKVDSRICQDRETSAQLRRGDRVGVEGHPIRTKAGELSIAVREIKLLAPCLRQIPSTGFENSHKRFRRRYVDFIVNNKSKAVILTRSKIIKYFRDFFQSRDFLEVETPILSSSAGGAIARPFTCHHNELDMDLYLRVAPELYLKQLVIGGFDRVFEIGKQFRNEGVDWNHNPEFTSCEFYEAWADYLDLMETTEELLSGLVTQLELQPTHHGVHLDFTSRPWDRLEFLPSLESALGCDLAPASHLEEEDSKKQLAELCVREGLVSDGSVAKLLDRLSGKLVEPALIQPTLLLHQPLIMSPLAKAHRDQPGLAERFEVFVSGQEICNAYTELNDPELQRAALAAQACSTDPEAMLPDELFCTALEYGLPPTAGWGCGLDRLTAILTGRSHIRDTITFPLVSSRT